MKKTILIIIAVFIGVVFLAHADETISQKMVRFYDEKLLKSEKGDLEALKELCDDYKEYGVILSEDKARVFKVFERCAKEGDVCCQYSIGSLYTRGVGVQADNKKAIKWFEKAANQGDAFSSYEIGLIYSVGKSDMPENYKQAFRWFKKAAEAGTIHAQAALGDMYYHGQGIPVNYKLSFYWHEKAAAQGESFSQCRIGEMFFDGQGVDKNETLAFQWYKKAAERKNTKAQMMTGLFYSYGVGGEPINTVAGYKWLSIAIAGNDKTISDKAGEFLKEISARMTSVEIDAAQKEAEEWWAKFNN